MKAIGIILAGGNNKLMKDLSKKRAIAAMPVAGSYRAIDFALSNMSNSRINKVAVITQYNARSLNEHLSSSKWWDFGRKQGGLFVFTPTITADSSYWYRGTADSLYQNLNYLKTSHEPYVVIASGDGIYKMDYNKVLEYHIEKKADITMVVKKMTDRSEINRLIRYKNIKKIYGYKLESYWSNISSVRSYYKTNMDFLKKDVRDYFFKQYPDIYSKVEDLPPAKYNCGAQVSNSLVSSGCIVNGTIENSILFKKIYIGNNSVVKNCIILNNAYIGDNSYLENCIVESGSTIKANTNYKGEGEPLILDENSPIYY